jgi:transcriptional regulator GlxA family with amidase domain
MGTHNDPRIDRALDWMREQLHRQLTNAELAGIARLSVAQFTRLFKRSTGMTPHVFLHQLRIARARILVERTDLPVSVIMAQVGISDRSHFARNFRAIHGVSPRALRMELRPAHTRPRAG